MEWGLLWGNISSRLLCSYPLPFMARIQVHQQPVGSLGHSHAQPNQVTPWTYHGEDTPSPSSSGDACNTDRGSRHELNSLKAFTSKQSKSAISQIQSDKLYRAHPCRHFLLPSSAQTMSSTNIPHSTVPDWLHFQLQIQRKTSIERLDGGFHFPLLSNQQLINSQCPSEVNVSVSCINTYICIMFDLSLTSPHSPGNLH